MSVSFLPILDYIVVALKKVWHFVWDDYLLGYFSDWVSDLIGLLPGTSFNLSDFMSSEVYTFVESWFPIQYGVICLSTYFVIAGIVYLINWILGVIPTVS